MLFAEDVDEILHTKDTLAIGGNGLISGKPKGIWQTWSIRNILASTFVGGRQPGMSSNSSRNSCDGVGLYVTSRGWAVPQTADWRYWLL